MQTSNAYVTTAYNMKSKSFSLLILITLMLVNVSARAQNPFIRNQFTADPSARVFNGRVYVYPSHDIKATPGHGRAGWFVMEDYHVFSSDNLTNWTDHGIIISQNKVPWADSAAYSMWAPDCIFRNGKYYFYFPTAAKDKTVAKGFTVGVAVADKPFGPFIPQPQPIKGVQGIDPNVLIDKDGQAYLYWSQGNIYAAKLKENMLELASAPQVLENLPTKGLKEGPYMFERKGIYYLTYPHVENKIERLEYATSDKPMGPFKFAGVIMDESPTGCWTNHHSIIEFNNQYYLFYHGNDLSPQFDKNRSIRIDSLFINADGSIKKVHPTLRGVGLTKATQEIQIDRYSDKSDDVTIAFLDTANKFEGWKARLNKQGSWIRYNAVDFEKNKLKAVEIQASSQEESTVEIRLDKIDGPVISSVKIGNNANWHLTKTNLSEVPFGKHDLYIILKGKKPVEIDWIKFE